MSSISTGHLLTVTPDSFFSVVTILQLFRTCSVFSSRPQQCLKWWHQCQWHPPWILTEVTTPHCLSHLPVSRPLWLVTTLRTVGLWFLFWPQNVISGMEKSSVEQAGCPVSLCGVPGVWPAHSSLAYGVTIFSSTWREMLPKTKRVQCGFWTFFSFVLFLWCL